MSVAEAIDATLPPLDPFQRRYLYATQVSKREDAPLPPDVLQFACESTKRDLLRDMRRACGCTDEELTKRFEFHWNDFRPVTYWDEDTQQLIVSKNFLRAEWDAYPKQVKV